MQIIFIIIISPPVNPSLKSGVPLTADYAGDLWPKKRDKLFRQALKSLWRKKLTILLSKPPHGFCTVYLIFEKK